MGATLDLVNSLLDGPTGRRDEKQILTLLREAPAGELNDVLENCLLYTSDAADDAPRV